MMTQNSLTALVAGGDSTVVEATEVVAELVRLGRVVRGTTPHGEGARVDGQRAIAVVLDSHNIRLVDEA